MPTPSVIFDYAQLHRQRARAARLKNADPFLITRSWQTIAERLQDIKRNFDSVFVLGHPLPDFFLHGPNHPKNMKGDITCCDPVVGNDTLPDTPAAFDLALSVFSLHALNDLPGVLSQLRRILKPDGVFLAAFPGGETLHELRTVLMQAELDLTGGASPRVIPMIDMRQMGALLQRAGFALPVVDHDIVHVAYRDLPRLFFDLRAMGEGNAIAARSPKPPPRQLFTKTETLYRQIFSHDDLLPATFEIIHAIGWAPHESQQKPLEPGSGQVSLTKTLSTQ